MDVAAVGIHPNSALHRLVEVSSAGRVGGDAAACRHRRHLNSNGRTRPNMRGEGS